DPSPPDGDNGGNIPDDALITADDITPEGQPGDVLPEWTERDAAQTPFECAPAAPPEAAHVYYENTQDGQGGHFLQFIEETDDPVGRFSQIRADLERCVRDLELSEEDTLTQISQVWNVDGLGDEAWMANYFEAMEEPINFVETNLVSVRMMRTGDYVNVVIQGHNNQEDNANMDTEDSVLSGERLCAAFGTECVGEVTAERTDKEPIGDIDGWLTVDDVVEATGLEKIVDGTEPVPGNEAGDPSGWALTYLPLDPEADGGATWFQRRFYQQSDPTEAIYLSVDQEIAAFPDAESARSHYEDLVAAAESYDDDGRNVVNTASADDGNRTISTWREEYEEYGITFVFGIALQDNLVTVVNHNIDSASDHDITADQMTDLLNRAADRLSE
ncbi:sensor domain-containing protein, partial [Phytoactinopolyspora endophytica]|uniref:sensor domain-containing protein n=1 Tax=Phytoactinopolyspora endophytica TaxID=1642495 RepID=UPI00197BC60F